MSLVRWTEPHFKSDLTPVKVERHDRRKARQEALDAAYRAVEIRDKGICWVTGRHLTAGAIDPANRREHHHLVKRSQSKALRERPMNIILVSALAHDLIERGWILIEGKRADRPIFFHWHPDAKSRPLVIRRRNLHAETK
jgi:hypothetical protein